MFFFCLLCVCLQKFPELKFKYVEEDQPEDFFIPYVWSLVFNSGVGLHWSTTNIQLFSMDSAWGGVHVEVGFTLRWGSRWGGVHAEGGVDICVCVWICLFVCVCVPCFGSASIPTDRPLTYYGMLNRTSDVTCPALQIVSSPVLPQPGYVSRYTIVLMVSSVLGLFSHGSAPHLNNSTEYKGWYSWQRHATVLVLSLYQIL